MKQKPSSEDCVFKLLIQINVDFMNPFKCISLKEISEFLNLSKYLVRKHLNSLKDKGFVSYKIYTFEYEDEPPYRYHGYKITDKAKETELFKKLSEESLF